MQRTPQTRMRVRSVLNIARAVAHLRICPRVLVLKSSLVWRTFATMAAVAPSPAEVRASLHKNIFINGAFQEAPATFEVSAVHAKLRLGNLFSIAA